MAIKVIVNGLPGKMATEVANAVVSSPDFQLMPFSLTGPEIDLDSVEFGKNLGKISVDLIKPENRAYFLKYSNSLRSLIRFSEEQIVADFTHPSAVNENATFYCDNEIPFVMGTTGGDRKALEDRVRASGTSAVIAPNMAKQIVAFQAMMQYAAENFPDVFKNYSLEIVESHQRGKADTSGTAKAMVGYFNALGIPFAPDQISMVRNMKDQLTIGVPQEHLSGHGWHTYTLKSEDGNTLFQFTHNVNGRNIYAQGTLDAVRFLSERVKLGKTGRVYSMIDVLRESL